MNTKAIFSGCVSILLKIDVRILSWSDSVDVGTGGTSDLKTVITSVSGSTKSRKTDSDNIGKSKCTFQ